MSIETLIKEYISTLPAQKQEDVLQLQKIILEKYPDCKKWFLDGKDETGKVVTNPNIGFGQHKINYVDGSTKDFYRVGISGNKTGISVYIMSIADKKYLASTYADRIGKASITGYCIKFKSFKEIDVAVLADAMNDGMKEQK